MPLSLTFLSRIAAPTQQKRQAQRLSGRGGPGRRSSSASRSAGGATSSRALTGAIRSGTVSLAVAAGRARRARAGRRRPRRRGSPGRSRRPRRASSGVDQHRPGGHGGVDRLGAARRGTPARRGRRRADTVRCSVGGHVARTTSAAARTSPRASISSLMVNTSQLASVRSATSVESGAASTCSSGDRVDAASTSAAVAVERRAGQRRVALVADRAWTTAQAAASGPPDLVDCIVELSIV